MCRFCEYYNWEKEYGEKIKDTFSVKICVKIITCRSRKGSGGLSTNLSRMFPIKYCQVCGKKKR